MSPFYKAEARFPVATTNAAKTRHSPAVSCREDSRTDHGTSRHVTPARQKKKSIVTSVLFDYGDFCIKKEERESDRRFAFIYNKTLSTASFLLMSQTERDCSIATGTGFEGARLEETKLSTDVFYH